MHAGRATALKRSRFEPSRARAGALDGRLNQRILRTLLPELAAGFLPKHGRRRGGGHDQLESQDIFDGSIVLLFRLLFLLHAEARGLPSNRPMPAGGDRLQTIAAEIAAAAGNDRRQVARRIGEAYSASRTTLSERLDSLFRIMPNSTDDQLLHIDRFLFKHSVSDRALALAIDGLARDVDKTGKLATLDYRSLDVRHLGSIYESLLEHKLVASGPASVRLARDTTRRRATGAFYTPPAIVAHIIEQTVGAVLDKQLAALRPKVRAACAGHGLPAPELLERLLDVRVLDPAMGTGNFLLAAAECISQRVAGFLAEFPAAFVDELLNTAAGGSQAVDHRSRLKRLVLTRCVYGVDLDPLAVELARFCLWLDGGSGEAPLPALDHLRCGNALVGAGWHDVPDGVVPALLGSEGSVSDRLANLRIVFDLLTASHFDLPEAAQALQEIGALRSVSLAKGLAAWKARGHASLVETVRSLAVQPDVRFFHWELEFPEVFFDFAADAPGQLRHKNALSAGSAGFDAVVGNPPYVDSETMTRHHGRLRTACARMLPACRGNWDLFCAFMDRGLSLLNERGIWSQIVPNKLLAAEYAAAIQRRIGEHTLLAIRDYSRASVFEDAGVYPLVPLIAKRRTAGDIQIQIMAGSDPAALRVERQWPVPQARLASLPPGCWSPIVSRDWELLERILENSITLEAAGFEIQGSATVAEAYRLAEILHDAGRPTPAADEIRLLNSGTIDPFRALWGERPTRYLNTSYAFPVVRRAELERLLPARAAQAAATKAIVAGMTRRIEAVFDAGSYLAGKSTTIIRHADRRAIELVVAVLNSAVTALAFRRLFESLSLSGGYLRVGPPQLRRTLVPKRLMAAIADLREPEAARASAGGNRAWPASDAEACQRLLSAARSRSPEQRSEVDLCAGFLFGLTADQTAAICAWLERGQLPSPVQPGT